MNTEPTPSILFVGKDAKSRIAYLLHMMLTLIERKERGEKIYKEDFGILHDHIHSLLEMDNL